MRKWENVPLAVSLAVSEGKRGAKRAKKGQQIASCYQLATRYLQTSKSDGPPRIQLSYGDSFQTTTIRQPHRAVF